MRGFLVKPDLDRQAYSVRFHVRAAARASPDELDKRLHWSLDRMIRRLERQGWTFVRLSEQAPRGPLPVVPIKGFGKPPPKQKRTPGQPSAPPPPDDSLWRVSTLPDFGPRAAHLVTDEVDWEYTAIFQRPTVITEYQVEQGAPPPAWLKH
jgi:hypothetical protein